jgi:hypothetical protein
MIERAGWGALGALIGVLGALALGGGAQPTVVREHWSSAPASATNVRAQGAGRKRGSWPRCDFDGNPSNDKPGACPPFSGGGR